MAIHKPWDRTFYLENGAVMTTGHSLSLAKGQFGIFDVTSPTSAGSPAVTAFTGAANKSYELRLGNKQKMTRTTSNKMYSSFPFHLADVISIVKSSAKNTTMVVDELEVLIGDIYPGENKEIVIELKGKALEYLGVPEGIFTVVVPLFKDASTKVCKPEVDNCVPVDRAPLIDYAVEYLRAFEFRGGAKFTDYVEVTAIKEPGSQVAPITPARYGLKLKGKVFKVVAGEDFRDTIHYIEDSVMLRAGGGYITDFNWSTTNGRVEDRPFEVNYITKYEPRTHVGGYLLDDEARNKTFFTGRMFNHDYLGRVLSGNESGIVNLEAQYIFYAVTIKRNIFAQGLSSQLTEFITYHIAVESGKETALESLLTSLGEANPAIQVDMNVATEEETQDEASQFEDPVVAP